MKKYYFFLAVLMFGYIAAMAEEPPEAVNVYRTDGNVHSTMFDNLKNIVFVGDNLEVQPYSGVIETIAMDDVENVVFGKYIVTKHVVVYSVLEGLGNLSASVDGVALLSGSSVAVGSVVQFTAVPDENYKVKAWYVDGTRVSSNTTNYLSVTVESSVSVEVEFEIEKSVVTYSVLEGLGNLSASVDGVALLSGSSVAVGSVVQFTAVPDENYKVKAWYVDGAIVPSNTNNIFERETTVENVDVTVAFKIFNSALDDVFSSDELKVYEAQEHIVIESSLRISSVSLIDVVGRIIYHSENVNQTTYIPTHSFTSDVYLINIVTEKGVYIDKVIVKK